MEIRTFGVVGAGTMGNGIAHTAAQFGYRVILNDLEDRFLDRGMKTIDKNLQRGVDKGKMSEPDKKAVLERIQATTRLEALSEADIVVEAILENLEAKTDLFRKLDEITGKGTILASNTSSISITRLAAVTGRADRVIGMHFMNPVPVMKLVEIVKGIETSDEALAEGTAFIEGLGKTTILAKDTPGFLINVLLVPYLCEAVRLVEAGVGTKEDIDKGMNLGCNMPMGPITLLDFVGLDTTLAIADVLYDEFRDPKYAAPPLLRRMVESGF
ncbi:MAG: 3-hydroxybutyryl-CoA dehydrogenase, partial [Acidobacteriota bacterium]